MPSFNVTRGHCSLLLTISRHLRQSIYAPKSLFHSKSNAGYSIYLYYFFFLIVNIAANYRKIDRVSIFETGFQQDMLVYYYYFIIIIFYLFILFFIFLSLFFIFFFFYFFYFLKVLQYHCEISVIKKTKINRQT